MQSANSLRIKIRWNLYRGLGTNYRDDGLVAQGKYLLAMMVSVVTGEESRHHVSGEQHEGGHYRVTTLASHWSLAPAPASDWLSLT